MELDKLKEWAEAGDAEVMCRLAIMYREGGEVARDLAESHRWLEKAAEADYFEAFVPVAEDYRSGCGVEQDYGQAVRWLQKAVTEQQDAAAMQMLLDMCQGGQGMEVDDMATLTFLADALAKCPQNIYEENPLNRIMIFGTYSEDTFTAAHEKIIEYRRLACQVKKIMSRKG